MTPHLPTWTSLALVLAACATTPPASPPTSPAAVAASEEARRGAPKEKLPWAELSAATFARAKAERRLIILDGSAEWCHWCHVMEAETYNDPRVRALLDKSFIAVKVDVDSRPDLEERYGAWGWPATVVFSPDGVELGKYRGFIEPDRFLQLLSEVVATQRSIEAPAARLATAPPPQADPHRPLARELVDWAAHAIAVELDDYWDPVQGGWGRRQKAPVGAATLWLLRRAAAGDAEARRRVLFTLDKQAALIDPVWGGIYQYSEGSTWDRPHYEKLMSYQAPALESYARAYQLTKDPTQLARAKAMRGYLERFLRTARGTYAGTQDADLGAHDPKGPFLRGAEYYAKDEKQRLALGIPRVDPHEYAEDSGLAIAALVTYYEATGERDALESAQRAARAILASHADPRGGVTHEPYDARRATPQMRYLADNAALGLGLVRLAEVSRSAEDSDAALGIARFLVAELHDEEGGGFFAHTTDPAAIGVFALRRSPVEDSARALQFLARLAALRREAAAELAPVIAHVTRFALRPENVKAVGRFVGEQLLAIEEVRQLGDLPSRSAAAAR